ncbi:hypothetical protein ACO0LB_17700 [Undibacterium sp. SXout7W]|uniref:hypothetical protein n=1 Tax=Undibacterium sp. SXout7W TaxID=3413049 RepID=UPI003BF29B69
MASDKNKKSPTKVKKIPTSAFENFQLDLFQKFLCNTDDERSNLGNTIDLWDSIPKYSMSRQAQNKLRSSDGRLKLLKLNCKFGGRGYQVVIQPARIEVKDKETDTISEIDFYPSSNEELIEDALRKIASEQDQGFFDKFSYRSGAVFTLYMLREELAKRKHTRSFQEIILSLEILSKANIEINCDGDGDGVGFSSILPALAGVTRKDLEANAEAKWIAQFHPLVTRSIDELRYKQYNYDQMMSHSSQLARWLHKQLSTKFTYAAHGRTFDMLYSTIDRDSALLNGYKHARQGIQALDDAFSELEKNKVLMFYTKDVRRGSRNKIEDVSYTLTPSPEFVAAIRASNKRLSDGRKLSGEMSVLQIV